MKHLSLVDLFERFPNQEAARMFLETQRWVKIDSRTHALYVGW